MGCNNFCDHYSEATFVHLQKSLHAFKAIDAKRAFKGWSNLCDVKIKHCHADNSRFAETVFLANIAKQGQAMSFVALMLTFKMVVLSAE